MLSLFKKVDLYKNRIAIECDGEKFSYSYLAKSSNLVASFLLREKNDLKEKRIGLLITPNQNYVIALWGIWKAGGVAVPLSLSAKESELKHFIADSNISLIISSKNCNEKKNLPKKSGIKVQNIEEIDQTNELKLPSLIVIIATLLSFS